MKRLGLMLMAVLSVTSVVGAFFGLPTGKYLQFQPMASLGFLIVLALTPVWGRFFCGWLCPLGILQSLVNKICHPKTHVRRVCTRLPETKAQRIVRWTAFALWAIGLAFGFGALVWSITPYSILGKALTLSRIGLGMAIFVLILAAIGRGRIWCNWICPVGTVFNLLSRKCAFPHKINGKEGCGNCRACFPQNNVLAANEAKKESSEVKKENTEGLTRREALTGVAVLAAADVIEKTTDGGFAPVSLPGIPERPAEVLPPGAVARETFNRLCVGCGACITACPQKCLVASTSLKTFGQPKMNFQHSYCRLACNQKCAQACPVGALKVRKDLDRKDMHMGHAIWKKDRCLRTTQGVECMACVKKCPVKAIAIVEGVPVIDKAKCIGCGACEHVCPVRPLPAIFVKGFDQQRCVKPMAEEDLIAEVAERVRRDEVSVVVAKYGVIRATNKGRGLKPLLELLDQGKLKDGLVVDKIIGRAAAAILVSGRARKVYSLVMSEGGKKFLEDHGIEAVAEKVIPVIINRKKTGQCPMENRVKDMTEPRQMVEACRKPVDESELQ